VSSNSDMELPRKAHLLNDFMSGRESNLMLNRWFVDVRTVTGEYK